MTDDFIERIYRERKERWDVYNRRARNAVLDERIDDILFYFSTTRAYGKDKHRVELYRSIGRDFYIESIWDIKLDRFEKRMSRVAYTRNRQTFDHDLYLVLLWDLDDTGNEDPAAWDFLSAGDAIRLAALLPSAGAVAHVKDSIEHLAWEIIRRPEFTE